MRKTVGWNKNKNFLIIPRPASASGNPHNVQKWPISDKILGIFSVHPHAGVHLGNPQNADAVAANLPFFSFFTFLKITPMLACILEPFQRSIWFGKTRFECQKLCFFKLFRSPNHDVVLHFGEPPNGTPAW